MIEHSYGKWPVCRWLRKWSMVNSTSIYLLVCRGKLLALITLITDHNKPIRVIFDEYRSTLGTCKIERFQIPRWLWHLNFKWPTRVLTQTHIWWWLHSILVSHFCRFVGYRYLFIIHKNDHPVVSHMTIENLRFSSSMFRLNTSTFIGHLPACHVWYPRVPLSVGSP